MSKKKQLYEGKKHKSFKYYRYRAAEWLHKLVNMLTWTMETDIGYRIMFDKEDLDQIRKTAEHINATYEDCLHEVIGNQHSEMMDILLKMLEKDGYLRKTVDHNDDGNIYVGFRFSMLGMKAVTVLNNENGVRFTIQGD